MPGIRDTAYPQLKSSPSAKELADVYTPNFVELVWAEKRTKEPVATCPVQNRLFYSASLIAISNSSTSFR
jgi:hypothetical protein